MRELIYYIDNLLCGINFLFYRINVCNLNIVFKYPCNTNRHRITCEKRTFAATGDGSLPLPPRGSTWLLRCLLDIRNVRIIEVQGERVGHGYGETSGNHYWGRSSAKIRRILARSAIDAVAPALLLSPASWSLGPSRSWSYVTADTSSLM